MKHLKRLLHRIQWRIEGKTRTSLHGDNCGDVSDTDGACMWPLGHRGTHWYTTFAEPRS